MENAGKETVVLPSLTRIVMFEYVPALDAFGVPDKRPVLVLNEAHVGRFWILNVKALPSGSDALGVNEYEEPMFTLVLGVPLIVGARLVGVVGAFTVIENAASVALARPSLTLMRMLLCVPPCVGVPLNRPVEVLKLAQLGRF